MSLLNLVKENGVVNMIETDARSFKEDISAEVQKIYERLCRTRPKEKYKLVSYVDDNDVGFRWSSVVVSDTELFTHVYMTMDEFGEYVSEVSNDYTIFLMDEIFQMVIRANKKILTCYLPYRIKGKRIYLIKK